MNMTCCHPSCSATTTTSPAVTTSWCTFDASELGGLVYLHAALCECLRLYPSVPSGHKAKGGDTVLVYNYSMGRMERVWGEDSAEFRPERWIAGAEDDDGCRLLPRQGARVRADEGRGGGRALERNFAAEAVPGNVVEPKLSVILHMKNGLAVRVARRNQLVKDGE
ncbi:hypothetical protein EJB05_14640, partial [Eragrostis curvula]